MIWACVEVVIDSWDVEIMGDIWFMVSMKRNHLDEDGP
jgi:hypothetical protein